MANIFKPPCDEGVIRAALDTNGFHNIEGKPPDVVEAIGSFNAKLQESDLPKLLFTATPGGLMRAPIVEWCQQNLKNLRVVNIGQGIHFLQEDNPHLIGSELANWYSSL